MIKLTILMSILLLGAALSACSSQQFFKDDITSSLDTQIKKRCADEGGGFHNCKGMQLQNKTSKSESTLFNVNLHFNRLSEYTEQMAADLQNDVRGMQVEQTIVVASFVHLDSTLQTTDALGIQLAESFINDLQQIGLPVADHKLMGVLNVNEKGDFAFSRDTGQFYNEVNIGYVLTGTMQKKSKGLVVNARLINYTTNKVIASASKFLPNVVVNNLM